MSRLEKDFQREIRQSLRTLEGPKFYHKIADTGYQNPFDGFLVYNGRFIALEYKIVKTPTSLPLGSLFKSSPHELQKLTSVKAAGGRSYIFINYFVPHIYNLLFYMDPQFFESLLNYIAPAKSIKIDEAFEKIPFIKHEGDVWPLNKIFDGSLAT